MSSSSRERRAAGVSIVEVLVCVVMLAVALVPILDLTISSSRMGHSARRMVDASVYGQTILEGLAMLEPEDFPDIPPGVEQILLDGDQPGASGGPRFMEAATYFNQSAPFEFIQRVVSAKRHSSGGLLLTVDLKWLGVVADDRTVHSIRMHVLTPPRKWL